MSTDLSERIRDQNAAWWAAHPDVREKWKGMWTFQQLAQSVVHWHHNVESARRHRPTESGDRYFLREYAWDATRAWLIEAQRDLETYPPHDAFWRGYGHTDQECLIRNLQVALDDFEANGHTP